MAERKYSCRRYRYVDNIEDMQFIYDTALRRSGRMALMSNDESHAKYPLKKITRIEDGDRYYSITTIYVSEYEDKYGNTKYKETSAADKYACTWIFDKTGMDVYRIHPSRVARLSNNYYKPNKIVSTEDKDGFERSKEGKIVNSARPILGYNKKFDKTEHNVVIYDLNSAYAEALTDKIIDTYNSREYGIVGENEVGFMTNDCELRLRHEGDYADIIFPLIDSPYKEYARKYYEQKKTAPKGSKERDLAKQILVITVGLFQNTNPYLRAYIVGRCNEKIEYFIRKYKNKICMWNTDAVYATEHIKELDDLCGEDIGQFKVEYEGLFRQKGLNYQKVDDCKTTYRGVLKMLFKEGFNILTDDIPVSILPYRMNEKTLKIEKNKEYDYE